VSKGRAALAVVVGAVIWGGAIALASRLVVVPAGAFAFWAVLAIGLLVLALLLPIHGFHGQSLKAGIGVIAASWVALGPMQTPLAPLTEGIVAIGVCFLPAVLIAGLILARGEPGADDREAGS
jgi:hypothetical protein